MSRTTTPTVVTLPARRLRARPLGTKDSSAIAASTRSLVACATASGRLSTLETVPTDTPASFATSSTDARRVAFLDTCLFSHSHALEDRNRPLLPPSLVLVGPRSDLLTCGSDRKDSIL